MIRRKTVKTTKRKSTKNEFVIDGKKYQSKVLYDAHIEFKEAVKKRLISSFDLGSGSNKKSRYTAYKPVLDDIKFDSLMEARYYIYLKELEKEGKIFQLSLQVPYTLQESFTKNGKKYRPIIYVSDFVYLNEKDKWIVVDIKGKETVEFKLKQKLFEFKYPELSLSVIQFHDGKWMTLSEIRKLKRKKK